MSDSIHSEQVKAIVADILKIDRSIVTDDLAIGDVPEWDSVANVKLLQALEEVFSIEIDVFDALDAEDIYDFTMLIGKYVNA